MTVFLGIRSIIVKVALLLIIRKSLKLITSANTFIFKSKLKLLLFRNINSYFGNKSNEFYIVGPIFLINKFFETQ